jgi:hypothetical protein
LAALWSFRTSKLADLITPGGERRARGQGVNEVEIAAATRKVALDGERDVEVRRRDEQLVLALGPHRNRARVACP